jgi:hypothetical protein
VIRIKNNKQTVMTPGDFLISATPEAIEWNPVFEGVEIAVISGDPNKATISIAGQRAPLPDWSRFAGTIENLGGRWSLGRSCHTRKTRENPWSQPGNSPGVSLSRPRVWLEWRETQCASVRTRRAAPNVCEQAKQIRFNEDDGLNRSRHGSTKPASNEVFQTSAGHNAMQLAQERERALPPFSRWKISRMPNENSAGTRSETAFTTFAR